MDKDKTCKIVENENGLWFLNSGLLTNCGGYDNQLSAIVSAKAFGYTDIEIQHKCKLENL